MSYSGIGANDSINTDCCKYRQDVTMSTAPYYYYTYFGQGENCNRFVTDGPHFKQDLDIVDAESDLKNLMNPLSKCDEYKFRRNQTVNPPNVVSPSLYPIVYSNMERPRTNGLKDMGFNNCREQYREAINRNKFIDANGKPLYK
jgi:hypothetical protein